MPQHLWNEFQTSLACYRVCEVCDARQGKSESQDDWPHISPICPGDPDDTPRPVTRRRPLRPTGGALTRELEPA